MYSEKIFCSDVFDILSLLKQCISNPKTYNKEIEIGGDQVMSYMELLQMTSKQMDKSRLIFSIPFFRVKVEEGQPLHAPCNTTFNILFLEKTFGTRVAHFFARPPKHFEKPRKSTRKST